VLQTLPLLSFFHQAQLEALTQEKTAAIEALTAELAAARSSATQAESAARDKLQVRTLAALGPWRFGLSTP
jgi:hypothetical protein